MTFGKKYSLWQVTSRSSEVGFPRKRYIGLYLFLFNHESGPRGHKHVHCVQKKSTAFEPNFNN